MGGTLRDCCLVAFRPFLLAVLLTVAWLAWAAGSANAASEDPNPLGAIGQATVSLLQDAGSTVAPALQDSPAQAAAVPSPVSGTAAAVVDVVDPVPGEATEVVTVVVNRAARRLRTHSPTPRLPTRTRWLARSTQLSQWSIRWRRLCRACRFPRFQFPHCRFPRSNSNSAGSHRACSSRSGTAGSFAGAAGAFAGRDSPRAFTRHYIAAVGL